MFDLVELIRGRSIERKIPIVAAIVTLRGFALR
jgi:hypothetical protein